MENINGKIIKIQMMSDGIQQQPTRARALKRQLIFELLAKSDRRSLNDAAS